MLCMCVYMHSRFVENHPIRILEDGPLISEVVLSQTLYLEELDCFMPRDTILLIQDFDWMLRVRLVNLEWYHFRQHDVHGCLQAFLQFQHVEDVMNSS
jgi:hypothetical protein